MQNNSVNTVRITDRITMDIMSRQISIIDKDNKKTVIAVINSNGDIEQREPNMYRENIGSIIKARNAIKNIDREVYSRKWI